MIRYVFVALCAFVVWQFCEDKYRSPSSRPRVGGYFHPAFRKVAETFRKNIESGLEKGASFAVYHDGELLVNVWGGWADVPAERHWQEDTLCMTWSVVKGVAAVAVARLVDMGHLKYQEKVSRYWPEFGVHGKENITVECLLSHSAGLITLDKPISLLEYKYNWRKVETFLAAQSPQWTPGTAVGYHALTYGMYVDALIRRADPHHRNISQFFQDEIASSIDIELFIGLPAQLFHRFARIHEASILEGRIDVIGGLFTVLNPYLPLVTKVWDISTKIQRLNDPELLSVGLPSSNAVGSARAVAKLYDFVANNGTVRGKRLLSPAAVAALSDPVTDSLPNVFHADNTFSRGMILRTAEGHRHVGHSGLPGNYGWADTTIGAGLAYLTNHLTMYMQDDPRQVSLRRAFLECFKVYRRGRS